MLENVGGIIYKKLLVKSFSSSLPEKQARIVQFSLGRARATIHISKCQSVFVNVNLDETLGVKAPLFSASCLGKAFLGFGGECEADIQRIVSRQNLCSTCLCMVSSRFVAVEKSF